MTLCAQLRDAKIDALIAVGGDGSLEIARDLGKKWPRRGRAQDDRRNDLEATTLTFGFDSAVSFATECIERLHSTAQAHRRVMVVEVMGRYAGWIALNAGIAGRAHAILIRNCPAQSERLPTIFCGTPRGSDSMQSLLLWRKGQFRSVENRLFALVPSRVSWNGWGASARSSPSN